MEKPKNIIVMKVGPHGEMNLKEIIRSKQDEEKIHGVHFWGYSGVFCQPRQTQKFCEECYNTNEKVVIVLLETKSPYKSNIGKTYQFSIDGIEYKNFKGPVQLSGAQFSFVAQNLREFNDFCIDDYVVVGGKNDGKSLSKHLKFRVNKSFAKLNKNRRGKNYQKVLIADIVEPYCIWLKE